MPTTRWSVVLAAGGTTTASSRDALAQLINHYQHPLYAYVRRRGHTADAARDLTQAFFLRLLESGDLADVKQERGRFRGWLRTAVDHFLANAWDRTRAQKRGGDAAQISLDAEDSERRYLQLPSDGQTPETLYLRAWVDALLREVLEHRLERRYRDSGKHELFAALKGTLCGEPVAPYAELAVRLGMKEDAIKKTVERLKLAYREALLAEVAETCAPGTDPEDELRELLSGLR